MERFQAAISQRSRPQVELELSLTFEIQQISKLETDIAIRHAAEITDDVVARKLQALPISVCASRDYVETHIPKAGKKGQGLSFIGYGPIPEMERWISGSAFPEAAVRHQCIDPEMHLHMVRAGAGMSFLPHWTLLKFPELMRVPGGTVDESRSTWVVYHEDLRRVRRVRMFVDFLAQSLIALGREAR